jgi:hypothetical protein
MFVVDNKLTEIPAMFYNQIFFIGDIIAAIVNSSDKFTVLIENRCINGQSGMPCRNTSGSHANNFIGVSVGNHLFMKATSPTKPSIEPLGIFVPHGFAGIGSSAG